MLGRFYVLTLGCPKNTVDSRQITGYLVREGYTAADSIAGAEIILVNTCGFIEQAKADSIEAILKAARWKKKGSCRYLIVTGCLVQKYSRELSFELPEVDAFLGTGDLESLPDILSTLVSKTFLDSVKALNFLEPDQADRPLIKVTDPNFFLFNETLPFVAEKTKHYAYIKIAEGCDNRCTYCVIPSMRGNYRSRTIENIVREAGMHLQNGARELILVAQDTTCYGRDNYGAYRLPALLQELAKLPDLRMLRLLYAYPRHLTEDLLLTIRNEPKICSYIDLPLQHISDKILAAMGRPANRSETVQALKTIRTIIPDIVLRTTFIVGFPGETEEDFAELLAFIRETKFDRAGFFAYSPQPGTLSALLPDQVPEEIKQYRLDTATLLQREIMATKLAATVNTIRTIIVDGVSAEYEGLWEGRTCGDAPEIDGVVYFNALPATKPGDIINVRITHSTDFTLLGEIIK